MNKLILFSFPILFACTITLAFLLVTGLIHGGTKEVPHASSKQSASSSAKLTIVPTKMPEGLSSAVRQYLVETFGDFWPTAYEIAREHNFDCNYGKGTTHIGLFAIDVNDPRVSDYELTDCIQNIDAAGKIFSEESFRPWGK